jgi:hypothetical protein
VNDRVDKDLQKSIKHFRLLGTLFRCSNIVLVGKEILFEDRPDSGARLKNYTAEIIKIRIIVTDVGGSMMTTMKRRNKVRTDHGQGNR